MTNHCHLPLETPQGQLAAGMRHLNGVWSQCFNRRHGRVGYVFQGRYKAIMVERESYLLELSRYVVLNPVRAGMAPAAAGHHTLRTIADAFGVHEATVSRALRRVPGRRREQETS